MRYAIVESGVVVNIALADQPITPEWIEIPEGSSVGPGWSYDGTDFAPPDPEPEPIPSSCTPAQGLVALFALKSITESDISQAIDQIPDPVDKYTAQIAFTRAVSWERDSAAMAMLAGMLGLDSDDLDSLFAYAVGVAL